MQASSKIRGDTGVKSWIETTMLIQYFLAMLRPYRKESDTNESIKDLFR